MNDAGGQKDFLYIVVGLGGVGSGALYWLSKRVGSGVLGLEQFDLGHEKGGSQDVSRIIRNSYHSSDYTKLTPHTYTAWEELERESGIQVCFKTGGVFFWPQPSSHAHKMLRAYDEALTSVEAPHEVLNGRQMRQRWPQFTVPDSTTAVYENDGGLVDAANGNSLHVQIARLHGAKVVENCGVQRMEKEMNGKIRVHTSQGIFRCNKVLVCAGAWVNDAIRSTGVQIPVTVTQEQVTYFATPHIRQFTKNKFPIFVGEEDGYDFYSIPAHSNSYFKLGIDAGGPPVTAQSRGFIPDPVREEKCKNFLKRYVPKAAGPIAFSKTCLYAMTPDRNFVIDTLGSHGWPNVIVCQGAGHVYKFASLMGRILSEMAIDGETRYEIAPFTLNRTALTDPHFKPTWQMAAKFMDEAKM